MEYVLNKSHINSHNLLFKIPVKNQNPEYLYYYRIIYTNHYYNLKYILLNIELNMDHIKQSKYSYIIDISNDKALVNKIYKIEKQILDSINIYLHKKANYVCVNNFKKKIIYSLPQYPNLNHFYLKISGVWESKTHIGIVYKLYYNTSTEKFINIVC